ncbi:MAG: hypothetical protein ACYCO5_02750, partial [Acidobacteriaceae bacterium]
VSTPASMVGSITSPSEASLLLLVPTSNATCQIECAKNILRYLQLKIASGLPIFLVIFVSFFCPVSLSDLPAQNLPSKQV